jgi:glucose-1-phosphate cytidylyltransferase
MKAVILCGGKGTRIRDVTEVLPKPMVPIGGKPILWHVMKIYSYYGINEFILCLGYHGWMIKEYFLNFKTMNNDFTIEIGKPNELMFHNGVDESSWKVTLADTGEEAMTGARLWKVKKYLEGEDHFSLTYGDGIAGIDLRQLINFHIEIGKITTLTGVRPTGRYGELSVDNNTVTHFNEKPQMTEGWVNGGFMLFDNKRVWDYFWPDEELILEKEPLPMMVRDRQVAVYKFDGFWLGMDTMREYNTLNELWSSGKAPWKVWS